MPSVYYGFSGYIFSGVPEPDLNVPIEINGHKIRKPNRFKNLAHERAYQIALVLAQKKHLWSGVTIMTTAECIDTIMFNGTPEIQLKTDAVNPAKVALDAMRFVPSFFEEGTVTLSQSKKWRKMWFLEIFRK